MLILPHGARAVSAHTPQIEDILTEYGLLLGGLTPTTPDAAAKLVDRTAAAETARLGIGNTTWNPTNSQWTPIYDRVHADFAAGISAALAERDAQAHTVEDNYVGDLAANLLQPDIDALQTYLHSEPGKRYAAFLHRIDATLGPNGLTAPGAAPVPAQPPPSDQQIRTYSRMLALSAPYEMAIATCRQSKDPSGCADIMLIFGGAIRQHRAEFAALDTEYASDLPGFEAFSGSDAAQHFFTAFSLAVKDLAKTPNPMAAWLRDTRSKHELEWAALYRAAMAKP